jgi:WD40 repeat protein
MGKVTIRGIKDLDKKIYKLSNAEEWCEVLRYSPCGKYLAAGSHDNKIYIYEVAK